MKKVILSTIVILGLGLSACSAKNIYHDDNAYNRANSASEKSLNGLDRDTK